MVLGKKLTQMSIEKLCTFLELEFQHVRYIYFGILIKKYGGFPVDSGMFKFVSRRVLYPQTLN